MSFVLPENIHLKKARHYFSSYLPLQLLLLLGLACLLVFVKKALQDYCSADLRRNLESYLARRTSSVIVTEDVRVGLGDLMFVRLVGTNEQYFYTNETDLGVGFQRIVNLDPGFSATWISLDQDGTQEDWVVVSKKLGDGLQVQAGSRYTQLVSLYERLRNVILLSAIISVIVAAAAAYFVRQQSLAAVRQAEKALAAVINYKADSLQTDGSKPELYHLYQLLNQLIGQNRQLIKEMQESLDNVAHDLRTPITRLRSVAEYGLKQNTPEELAEALEDCLEESERVSSMLAIMMSVVEAESGTLHLHREPLQLSSTIADVVNLYEYVAEERDICLQAKVDDDIYIFADRTRISQVWANLVDNGIKYGKKGGNVNIRAELSDAEVIVHFEDNGMGISTSELPRIWERLYRGDRSRTEQGLGLGLNYVRAVVEAHGGRTGVVSERGNGSTFSVSLERFHGEL